MLDDVQLFSSGGKGFHVVLPIELFAGKTTSNLHKIYGKIVETTIAETGMTGVDLQLYRNKKQLIRLPNMKRSNGCYKVPIYWNELDKITPKNYYEFCSKPRDLLLVAAPTAPNRNLVKLFNDAVSDLHYLEKLEKFEVFENIDFEVLAGQTPSCLKHLINYENLNKGASGGWNFAKQTAARSYASGLINDEQLELFALNFQSKKQPTFVSRLAEVKAIIKSFSQQGKGFSCGYALHLLDKNPCGGCPMKSKCNDANLLHKTSLNKKHIAAVVKALKTAKGKLKQGLERNLCNSVAKGVPSRQSVNDAVSFVVKHGVDEAWAREIVQDSVDDRIRLMKSANRITNFDGLKRVSINMQK